MARRKYAKSAKMPSRHGRGVVSQLAWKGTKYALGKAVGATKNALMAVPRKIGQFAKSLPGRVRNEVAIQKSNFSSLLNKVKPAPKKPVWDTGFVPPGPAQAAFNPRLISAGEVRQNLSNAATRRAYEANAAKIAKWNSLPGHNATIDTATGRLKVTGPNGFYFEGTGRHGNTTAGLGPYYGPHRQAGRDNAALALSLGEAFGLSSLNDLLTIDPAVIAEMIEYLRSRAGWLLPTLAKFLANRHLYNNHEHIFPYERMGGRRRRARPFVDVKF